MIQGKQIDEDRKAQLKAHAGKAVKEEYAGASKPCTEVYLCIYLPIVYSGMYPHNGKQS